MDIPKAVDTFDGSNPPHQIEDSNDAYAKSIRIVKKRE